jgi:Dolichyl-phosphate-mannose-protein mannosyltransferase
LSLRPPRWLVGPLLAGLLLRLAALFFIAPQVPLLGDALGYAFLGRTLRTEGSYADLQGGVRPPLYPLLVAAGLGGSGPDASPWPGVHLLQVACDLAALIVLSTLARRLFGAKAGAATAWAHACFPSAALYGSTVVMAESCSLLCTALAVERLEALDRALDAPRAWLAPAAWLGAALGVGLLVKETALMVAVAVLLALLLRRGAGARRLAAAGLALAVLVAVLLPWALRNQARHGVLLLTGTYGELSVITENAPPGESGWLLLQGATTIPQKLDLAHEILRRQFLEYPGLTASRAADRTRLLLGPEVMLPAWVAHGFDGYQPDARSVADMARDAWRLPAGVGRALQLLLGAGGVLFFALAAAGLVLAGPGPLRRATLLAALLLLLATAVTVAIARYRLVLVPFALPFVGLALAALSSPAVRSVQPWPRRRAALRTGLIAGAVLALTIFVLPAP